MFHEFLVRLIFNTAEGQKTCQEIIPAINSFMAKENAMNQFGCDHAIVLRDITGCEVCG